MADQQGLDPAASTEIAAFEKEVQRYRAGWWDPQEFIGFRTLRGVYGQRQPDAHMVRVKLPLGMLTADQMDTIGEIAEQHTKFKRAHLTTRQDFQFHFTTLEDASGIMGRLAEVGLTTREAGGNAVRNVTGSPLAGVCPREPFDVTPYAIAYARHFLRNPLSQRLPRKFKSSFSCCEQDDAISDIQDLGFIPRLRRVAGGLQPGFAVKVGGGTSIFPRSALLLTDFVPVETYLRLADAVVSVFDRCDELRRNRQHARLKFHVQRVGIEAFRAELETELGQPWGDWIDPSPGGGWQATAIPSRDAAHYRKAPPSGLVARPDFAAWRHSNTLIQRQSGFSTVTVRVVCGDLSADQLRALGSIARDYAVGELRATVQQNLMLRWVPQARLPELHSALVELGLDGPANAVSDVTSCPGTDSCKLAITASAALARQLSEELSALDRDAKLTGIHIKVSGCPNGCGQHHLADIGLEGAATRQGSAWVPSYHLYLGGSYSGASYTGGSQATLLGTRQAIRIPAKNVPAALRILLTAYREHAADGESFANFTRRMGSLFFRQALGDLLEAPPLGPSTLDFYRDFGRSMLFRVERGEGECSA